MLKLVKHGCALREGRTFSQLKNKSSCAPIAERDEVGWKDQGCQVGLFEAKFDKFGLFLMFGLKIFKNVLSSWPFFKFTLI